MWERGEVGKGHAGRIVSKNRPSHHKYTSPP